MKCNNWFRLTAGVAFALVFATASLVRSEESAKINKGEAIAFLGDSITQQGAGNPSGYVQLIIKGLRANELDPISIPAGIGGHKSNDMLARLDKDVISKKPVWMTLSCGVNDVWHGQRGVPLEQYKQNIGQIVEKAQAAGIKVVILTATMIGEDQENPNNQKLIPYNQFLLELAASKNLAFADLNADMQKLVKELNGGKGKANFLTTDGVHMGPLGNRMMAMGVLRALGLNDEQLAKAKAAWDADTNICEVRCPIKMSFPQYEELVKLARAKNLSVDAMLGQMLTEKALPAALEEAKAVK